MRLLAERFPEFAAKTGSFQREPGTDGDLKVGEVLGVRSRGAGTCQVRVIHKERLTFTLATLPGHPEAGRITFGAYRNAHGDIIFHIRSRARSSSVLNGLGFFTVGEPMQTSTWTDFVNCVALTTGEGSLGEIQSETTKLASTPEQEALHGPTFTAAGD